MSIASLILLTATSVSASEWVFVYEDAEQLMEFDKSSVQLFEGDKFVRERVTFKKTQVQDDGVKVKYLTLGALFSCRNKTETIAVVKKFSEDRKLISSGELKGMALKAIPGSPSLMILNQVCTKSELR